MRDVRTIIDLVRDVHPVDPAYFFFAGYLTPNGELHLGHLGGPYLRSDATARCLEMYGAAVACGTGSDAFESGVTYAAANSAPDRASTIATHFTERAAVALSGMNVRQDHSINPSQNPVRQHVAEACNELARVLNASGRLTVKEEHLFLGGPPGPAAATGAFVSGTCRFCHVAQSGNVCEQCGRWMSPEQMSSAWRPDGSNRPPRRGSVASVFVRTSPDMTTEAMGGVLEPEFGYLVNDYPGSFGESLRVSYPSWWGIPWSCPLAQEPHPDSVFSSYVMGKYGSARVLGSLQEGTLGTDPFSVGSNVTTVAAGGLDSAFGWISMHALTDPSLNFAPFDYIIVNRFMLMRGEKFSTSRKHVIRVNDALDAGWSPDVLRLVLARVSPGREESDFVPDKVAGQSDDDCSLLMAALRRSECGETDERDVEPHHLQRAVTCLLRQRTSFGLPSVDLPSAADALLDWATVVRKGDLDRHPRFARQVLAVLAYPLMPGWARSVWATAAAGALPGLSPEAAAQHTDTALFNLPPILATQLNKLIERGRSL
jgi:methionyl-tRNA synthetase